MMLVLNGNQSAARAMSTRLICYQVSTNKPNTVFYLPEDRKTIYNSKSQSSKLPGGVLQSLAIYSFGTEEEMQFLLMLRKKLNDFKGV